MDQHTAALKRLREFVDIRTDAGDRVGQHAGAQWLMERLRRIGFSVETSSVRGRPDLVVAQLITHSPVTLSVYSMYDTRGAQSRPRQESAVEERFPLGPCFIGTRPLGNKPAIEFFLSAIEAALVRRACPTIVFVAEGEEVEGSPRLANLLDQQRGLFEGAAAAFWPRLSQSRDGTGRVNLAYRGMLGLRLTASSSSWGRGPLRPTHSQYRPWVDAPSWRLVDALSSLARDNGSEVAFRVPSVGYVAPSPPATFHPEQLLSELGVLDADARRGSDNLWARLAEVSVNLEFDAKPGPGVGVMHPEAAANLQFRLPPGLTGDVLQTALRSHLDVGGWPDVLVQRLYAIDGAETVASSSVIRALLAMYQSVGARSELWPVATSTAPVCAFARFGTPFGDGGLGYQDDAQNLVALEDRGSRAGVDRVIGGFEGFLAELATGDTRPGAGYRRSGPARSQKAPPLAPQVRAHPRATED